MLTVCYLVRKSLSVENRKACPEASIIVFKIRATSSKASKLHSREVTIFRHAYMIE